MQKTVLLILAFFLLSACKSKKENRLFDVNPEFAAYVSAYTSGLVSTHSHVKVILQSDISMEINEDKSLKSEVFEFTPSLKGKTYLTGQSTLEFRPEENLEQGEIYTAELDLKKLIPNVPDSLKTFQFQFQAKKQDYTINLEGVQDNQNGQGNYNLSGEIYTADIAGFNQINDILTVKFDGKKLPVSWEHSNNQKSHRFTVNGIEAGAKAKEILLDWDGSAIEATKDETTEFKIPEKGTFAILQVKSVSYPEQYVSVNFSEALQSNSFLEGLVEIKRTNKSEENGYYEQTPSTYVKSTVINGNELRIYTSKKIGGEYNLNIYPGITSAYGNKISNLYTQKINFINLYPQVKFVGSGSIIPSSDGKVNLPFQAAGLKAVRVEITKIFENNIHQFFQYNHYDEPNNLKPVGRKVFSRIITISASDNFNIHELNVYQLELSKFIEPEPGAIYNVEFSFEQNFAAYPCGGIENNGEFLATVEPATDDYYKNAEMYSYDDYDYYYPEGYDWRDRDNPCTVSYYTSAKNVSKNVLASNLGINFKEGKNRTA